MEPKSKGSCICIFINQRYFLSFKIKINFLLFFWTKKLILSTLNYFLVNPFKFSRLFAGCSNLYISVSTTETPLKCLIILSNTASKYISPHCGLQKRKLAERSKQSPPWQSHNSWGQSDCI